MDLNFRMEVARRSAAEPATPWVFPLMHSVAGMLVIADATQR
jgi:hypothetical protein